MGVYTLYAEALFSYVADDQRITVSNRSMRKFTNDFTPEQSPRVVRGFGLRFTAGKKISQFTCLEKQLHLLPTLKFV